MKAMENGVRSIEMDGLVWGAGVFDWSHCRHYVTCHFALAAKLVPLAYGIKKLAIMCVVEDEKVSIDDLIERICSELEDHVRCFEYLIEVTNVKKNSRCKALILPRSTKSERLRSDCLSRTSA